MHHSRRELWAPSPLFLAMSAHSPAWADKAAVNVANSLGQRIVHPLDNSGNRREERIETPVHSLKRQVSRVFGALGRMQQTTGRE